MNIFKVTDGTYKNQAVNLRTSSLKYNEGSDSLACIPSYGEKGEKSEGFVSSYFSPNVSINSSKMRQNDESPSTNKHSGDSEFGSPSR